jgi:hypothetical protein
MDLRELRWGIEIETVKRTRQTVAEAIRTVVGGTLRHVGSPACYDPWEVSDDRGRIWKVVTDSSLNSVPPHLRAEIVSPVLEYADIPDRQKVIRAVRKVARAKATRGCGIHIHVDGAPFDARSLANLAKTFYKYEELLIRSLGVRQERLRRYCRPVSPEFIRGIERRKPRTREQLNRLWYGYRNTNPMRYDGTRYAILNFHSLFWRGSVEIRAFNGSLHAGRIRAYLVLCLALAANAINSRAASSKRRVADGKSDKYIFRTLLLRLGLIGDEFKNCRKHLMANLAGSAAWKNGRPDRQSVQKDRDGGAEEHRAHPAEGEQSC